MIILEVLVCFLCSVLSGFYVLYSVFYAWMLNEVIRILSCL